MTKRDLLRQLEVFSDDMEVMILDSFNGGGCPREINLGPKSYRITGEQAADSADCEGKEGLVVVVMGVGCY